MNWLLTLADDVADETLVPRMLDQLPDQAWNFGPLFVIILVFMIGAFAVIWYGVRRFDKHATKVIQVIEDHLKESETTQHQTQLTMAAMEVRLQNFTCRYSNGNNIQQQTPPVMPTPLPVTVQPPGVVP